MKDRKGLGKYENYILTLIVMAANVLLMGICFDFYFDLNDDTMMHDIMAGIYTGTPDGHNMQTLYPLGALIALCYRLCRTIPWYGLFLCLCQFGSFYLVGARLCAWGDVLHGSWTVFYGGKTTKKEHQGKGIGGALRYIGGTGRKIMALVALSLYMWGVCLPHLINIQYTITCAFMSAAAIFLFFTTPEGLDARQFLRWNIPSVLFVVVAYQLRTEMLLLTFPFICLAGLYRLTGEKKIFVKENLYRYGGVLGVILAGMALCFVIDSVAYSSAEWKEFRDFFDARTTVYDFYPELITDENYDETLTRLGVAPHRQALLRNYNFGLDEETDRKTLMALADYAKDTIGAAKDWKKIAFEKTRDYIYRIFHDGDAPYNIMVLWAYGAVLAAGMIRCRMSGNSVRMQTTEMKESRRAASAADGGAESAVRCARSMPWRKYDFLWQLILLAAVRTALWMFILLRGRDPERITHSLYLVEFAFLAAMLVRMFPGFDGGMEYGTRSCGKKDDPAGVKIGNRSRCEEAPFLRGVIRGVTVVAVICMAVSLTKSLERVHADQQYREQVNRSWHEIDDYCRSHGENFYFEDVYSTVAFSQKLFADRNNSYANYDILGGWMCKSPLYREKLEYCGIDSAQNALLTRDDVYLIMSDGEAQEQGFDWIMAYYEELGVKVTVEKTDVIGSFYGVYRVMGQSAEQAHVALQKTGD